MKGIRQILRSALNAVGYDIVRYQEAGQRSLPPDLTQEDVDTVHSVKPYTMTSSERICALCAATRYVISAGIPGAIVECGVWRGGSMMAVAKTLLAMGSHDRDLFLYDTFEGMSAPGEKDVSLSGERAATLIAGSQKSEDSTIWCFAPIDRVRQAVASTGYPTDRTHFIKGRVEDTICTEAPDTIALLRLDTDWYESTKYELECLFPRLSTGGVLIIDDYGHWKGARAAVDEYLAEHNVHLLLNRIDYTGRIAVKIPG